MTTTNTRRPAVTAELADGSIVYRGKGKVAYRVFTVTPANPGTGTDTVTASQVTTKPGTRPTWFHVSELTVEA
jgi:hypothetical protein